MNFKLHTAIAVLAILPSLSFAKPIVQDKPDSTTQKLLALAASTELAHAQTQNSLAILEAKRAKQKLIPRAKGSNAIERTTSNTQIRTSSPIDHVKLKSLVTTNHITTAWIDLGGELIEVKKGENIGALHVVNIDDSSITFNDGHNTRRKWMAGFKKPQLIHKEGQ